MIYEIYFDNLSHKMMEIEAESSSEARKDFNKMLNFKRKREECVKQGGSRE